eukprot:augustus_masked-scaffold_47-processed-gene-1.34-mRNA-1 protein AED:1.00 eAED:1.00 QI:0/-1/0/0/-1/1/1/0/121
MKLGGKHKREENKKRYREKNRKRLEMEKQATREEKAANVCTSEEKLSEAESLVGGGKNFLTGKMGLTKPSTSVEGVVREELLPLDQNHKNQVRSVELNEADQISGEASVLTAQRKITDEIP